MRNDFSCACRDIAYVLRGKRLRCAQMIDSNSSYQSYATGEQQDARYDRLPLGTAMLAVAALSLLGWAVVLLPVIAIYH
jgi:hypothetical protein